MPSFPKAHLGRQTESLKDLTFPKCNLSILKYEQVTLNTHIINKHFKINETWKTQITHTDTSIDLTNNYSSSCWNIYQKQNFHRLNFPALKQDLA